MKKNALILSLLLTGSSVGAIQSVDATEIQIAQADWLEFQGWNLYLSNMNYFTFGVGTQANITLNLRNLIAHSAYIREEELDNLSQVALVDGQGKTYRLTQIDGRQVKSSADAYWRFRSRLANPLLKGEIRSFQLSFRTPNGLHPQYLEIPRSQGYPIRLSL